MNKIRYQLCKASFLKKSIAVSVFAFFTGTTSFAQVGSALNFDGLNDGVNCSYSSAFNITVGTIEAWVRPTAYTGGNARNIVTKLPSPGSIGSNLLSLILLPTWADSKFRLNINVNGMLYTVASQTTPTLNTWYHVAATYDGDTMKIYVNGILENTNGTPNGPLNVGTGEVVLGNTITGAAAGKWEGDIDEVRYWSVVRTQAEVQAAMNCELTGPIPGLVANYHFNQGIAAGNNAGATTATDASGNNLHGTLFNFALSGATSNWVAPGAFANGSSCSVLPVKLLDFSGAIMQRNIALSWSVAQESNIEEYLLQRSADGIDFNTIASTKAKNASMLTHYTVEDESPLQGNNYYRIVIKEKNTSSISQVILLKNGTEKNNIIVSQIGNGLKVQLSKVAAGEYKVLLINSLGQILRSLKVVTDGISAKELIIDNITAKGPHQIIISSSTNRFNQGIMLY